MQLHDTEVSQENILKKNHVHLRDFEDQACNATKALQKYRLCCEEGQKKEEELRSKLEDTWKEIEKWQRVNMERHNFIKRLDIINRGLWETIASLTKELSTSRESVKTSEGRIADLEQEVKTLREEFSSAQE